MRFKGWCNMTNKDLADVIFPNITKTIEDYEREYPRRNLKDGAMVTRYAPSPTGFIHIGALLSCFINGVYARQSGGVFYLRIEDTDTERTIDNGINTIINGLKEYGVSFDEGPLTENTSFGNYGPYIQSKRKEIYQAFAKHLILEGKAYPCFCTEEEIADLRETQAKRKQRIGYYGNYAKCRMVSVEDAIERIKNNEEYVIRLKSPGDADKNIICHDEIRGDVVFPEYDLDIPIIKKDGLPTYHFAHLVDDYLMGTTHVIRGDEWLSSMPLHLQLFDIFGFERPKYVHISPLNKKEGNIVRKISKRKDPEFAMSYYYQKGIPLQAVREYLAIITNSDYEDWHMANPDKKIEDFNFQFSKMNKSGALYDMEKLINISKNYISSLTALEVYDKLLEYTKEFDLEFNELLTKYRDYSIDILNIERCQEKPRKDYASYSDVKSQIWYMYDEYFKDVNYEWQKINDIDEIKKILSIYIDKYYNENYNKEEWFDNIKLLSLELGYAANMKDYKKNPENYKGNVVDISTVIRVALTSKYMTPDLYEITRLLGRDRVINRINSIKY